MIFPEREMTILDYNRVVKDLNGHSAEQFLAKLRGNFTIAARSSPSARAHRTSSACISPDAGTDSRSGRNLFHEDPIGRLPITMLARNVIEPLLGIVDPRTDKRIDFVGGARGLEELESG